MLLRVLAACVAIVAISYSTVTLLGSVEAPLACCDRSGDCPSELVCCEDPAGDCSTEKIGYCQSLCIPPA